MDMVKAAQTVVEMLKGDVEDGDGPRTRRSSCSLGDSMDARDKTRLVEFVVWRRQHNLI